MNLNNLNDSLGIQGQDCLKNIRNYFEDHKLNLMSKNFIQWVNAFVKIQANVEQIVQLQKYGLFTTCEVTQFLPTEYGIGCLELQNIIRITVLKLISNEMDFNTNSLPALQSLNFPKKLEYIFTTLHETPMINATFDDVYNLDIPNLNPVAKRIMITQFRWRFEFQRNEAENWFTRNSTVNIFTNLQPYEKDRLYTIKSELTNLPTENGNKRMNNTMWFTAGCIAFAEKFMHSKNQSNVAQFASYVEFAKKYANEKKDKFPIPPNTPKGNKMKIWQENIFGDEASIANHHFNDIKNKYMEYEPYTVNMVGTVNVSPNLSDMDLITAISQIDVKFASSETATYHLYKHKTELGAENDNYVTMANEVIRETVQAYRNSDEGIQHDGANSLFDDGGRPIPVTLTQEGSSRTVTFDSLTITNKGKAIVIETGGLIRLATYMRS